MCKKLYLDEVDADYCMLRHYRGRVGYGLWKEGRNLDFVNRKCGFGWKLTKEQEGITKDSCFVISHWQLCDNPAYKIEYFGDNGEIHVGGVGGWMGYYGQVVKLDQLKDPRPKEELFVYEK